MSNLSLRSASVSARRVFLAVATAFALVFTTLGGSPVAQAQQVPAIEGLSSDMQAQANQLLGSTREQAWITRNDILRQIQQLNPAAATAVRPHLDNVVNALFPGLIAQKEAEAKAARDAAARAQAEQAAREKAIAEEAARRAEQQRQAQAFDRGACPVDADVCVDIDGRRTWLQDDTGNVSYIAPSMAPGRVGPNTETPRGTFWVTRKVKDEISYEFNNAPMPYAVYFTNNGHAFHMGDPAYDSAGCVRLPAGAAERYFYDLNPGDKVVIY